MSKFNEFLSDLTKVEDEGYWYHLSDVFKKIGVDTIARQRLKEIGVPDECSKYHLYNKRRILLINEEGILSIILLYRPRKSNTKEWGQKELRKESIDLVLRVNKTLI